MFGKAYVCVTFCLHNLEIMPPVSQYKVLLPLLKDGTFEDFFNDPNETDAIVKVWLENLKQVVGLKNISFETLESELAQNPLIDNKVYEFLDSWRHNGSLMFEYLPENCHYSVDQIHDCDGFFWMLLSEEWDGEWYDDFDEVSVLMDNHVEEKQADNPALYGPNLW